MTAAQIRAARGLLNWSQGRLAQEADLSIETIKRLERMEGELEAVKVSTLEAIRRRLAAEGVEFVDDGAPGVRLHPKPAS